LTGWESESLLSALLLVEAHLCRIHLMFHGSGDGAIATRLQLALADLVAPSFPGGFAVAGTSRYTFTLSFSGEYLLR
jgi:hypothetical protein